MNQQIFVLGIQLRIVGGVDKLIPSHMLPFIFVASLLGFQNLLLLVFPRKNSSLAREQAFRVALLGLLEELLLLFNVDVHKH